MHRRALARSSVYRTAFGTAMLLFASAQACESTSPEGTTASSGGGGAGTSTGGAGPGTGGTVSHVGGGGAAPAPIPAVDTEALLGLTVTSPETMGDALVAESSKVTFEGLVSSPNAVVTFALGSASGEATHDPNAPLRWSAVLDVPVGTSTLTLTAKDGSRTVVRTLELVRYDEIRFDAPKVSPIEPLPGSPVSVELVFDTAEAVSAVHAVLSCEGVPPSSAPMALVSTEGTTSRYTGTLTAPSTAALCAVRGEATLSAGKRLSTAARVRVWPALTATRLEAIRSLHDEVTAAIQTAAGTFAERFAKGAELLAKADGVAVVSHGSTGVWWQSVEGVHSAVVVAGPGDRGGPAEDAKDYEVTSAADSPSTWHKLGRPSTNVRPQTLRIVRGTDPTLDGPKSFKTFDDEVHAKLDSEVTQACGSTLALTDQQGVLVTFDEIGSKELVYVSSHGFDLGPYMRAVCGNASLAAWRAPWITCANPEAGSILTAETWDAADTKTIAADLENYGRSSLVWLTTIDPSNFEAAKGTRIHLTPGFFLNKNGNPYEGSVFVLDTCSSARGSALPSALLQRGAAAVLGYRFPVSGDITKLSVPAITRWMVDGYPFADALFSAQEALSFAPSYFLLSGKRACSDSMPCAGDSFCFESTCHAVCSSDESCPTGAHCVQVQGAPSKGCATGREPVARMSGDVEGWGLALVREGGFEDSGASWVGYPNAKLPSGKSNVGFETSSTALGVTVTPPSMSGTMARLQVAKPANQAPVYSYATASQSLLTPRLVDGPRRLSFKYRIVAVPDVFTSYHKPWVVARIDSKSKGNTVVWQREDASPAKLTCTATVCDSGWIEESVELGTQLGTKVVEDAVFTIGTGHAPLPLDYVLYVDDVHLGGCP